MSIISGSNPSSKLGNYALNIDLNNKNITSGIGTAVDLLSTLLSNNSYGGNYGDITKTADSLYNTASDIIADVPGWGTIASLGMKGAGLLNKGISALGGGTDNMTVTDSILGSNFLAPIGWINGFGGKRSHTLEQGQSEKDTISNVGGAYGGTVNYWQDASTKSNKKYGLFSRGARKKANRQIDNANNQMNTMTDISNTAYNKMEAANNMGDINNMRYQMQLQGGYNPTTRLGRKGLKIDQIKRAKLISNKVRDLSKHKEGGKVEESFFIPTDWQPSGELSKFQKGGSINIIPEGALHARLHHMKDTNNLTQKGVPVVDNDGIQQAEIERNEIIFRKEVTEKIEKLAKEGTEKAALECGKLLATEIVENTDDKTGLVPELLKKHQEGGMLQMSPSDLKIWQQNMQDQLFKTIPTFGDVQLIPTEEELAKIKNPVSKNTQKVSTVQVLTNAAKGLVNAISEGKKQKDLNEQSKLLQKETAISGTGDMDSNEQLYNQLIQQAQEGTKLPYEEWVKDVNSKYLSPLYDLKTAYLINPEQADKWKKAVNSDNPDYYLDFKDIDGNYPYHLNSVAELPNGDYIFLKLGKEDKNKELLGELNFYKSDKDFNSKYNLIFDKKANRYFYKKKPSKNKLGGIIETISTYDNKQLDKLTTVLQVI